MSRKFPAHFPKVGDVVTMREVENEDVLVEAQVAGRRWFQADPMLVFSDGTVGILISTDDGEWKWNWMRFPGSSCDGDKILWLLSY